MIDAADRDRFDQVKKEMEKMANADQLKVSSASNFKKLDETYINSKKCELE